MMNPQICLAIFFVLLSVPVPIGTKAAQEAAGSERAARGACSVTLPRKAPLPPNEAGTFFGSGAAHGNGALYVGGLWPDGTIVFEPGGPGFRYPDGSLDMKFGWYRGRGLRGKLSIHGKRLDGSAPPSRASIPEAYADTGFQATGVSFPTEGCWEVTGEVGQTRLTFVTRVVKVEGRK